MKNVYQAIAEVQTKLAKEGIGKARQNAQQGYKFRGIDDIYNAIAAHISDAGLCIIPRCISRESIERTNSKGNPLFYVTVCCEFDFVSMHDQSKHTAVTYGEAMDSADKATNKAMSAAYKYACLQTFCIPTEGDNDADATTHAVAALSDEERRGRTLLVTALEQSPEAFRDQWQKSSQEVRKVCRDLREEYNKRVQSGTKLEKAA